MPSFLANLAAGWISIRGGFRGPLGAPVTGVYDEPTAAAYRAFGDFLASLRTPQPEAA